MVTVQASNHLGLRGVTNVPARLRWIWSSEEKKHIPLFRIYFQGPGDERGARPLLLQNWLRRVVVWRKFHPAKDWPNVWRRSLGCLHQIHQGCQEWRGCELVTRVSRMIVEVVVKIKRRGEVSKFFPGVPAIFVATQFTQGRCSNCSLNLADNQIVLLWLISRTCCDFYIFAVYSHIVARSKTFSSSVFPLRLLFTQQILR